MSISRPEKKSWLDAIFDFFATHEETKQKIIKDEIVIESQLGAGTYGAVYRAKWNGRTVAVKKMQYNSMTLAQCVSEKNIMEKLTQLQAPNVVRYYGHEKNSFQSTYNLVMEFMKAGSLNSQIVTNKIPFAWQLRYRIAQEITSALAFMHDHGMLHCDMKSGNVLLDENMHAKLCDFGFATSTSLSVKHAGTLEWAAPELLNGKAYNNEKTDVYGLVMTIFELAAWRPPYPHLTRIQICEKVLTGGRETIPNDCLPVVANIINLGWRQNPDERPSAAHILNELNSHDSVNVTQRRIP